MTERPIGHVQRLHEQAKLLTEKYSTDAPLFDLVRYVHYDRTGHIHIEHITPSNRADIKSQLWLKSWAQKNEFHVDGDGTSPISLSPDDPGVTSMTICVTPDHLNTPRKQTVDESFARRDKLVVQLARPLNDWMKKEGARHYEIAMREIPNTDWKAPNLFLLRISIDSKQVGAQLCLGKIASVLNELRLQIPSSQR